MSAPNDSNPSNAQARHFTTRRIAMLVIVLAALIGLQLAYRYERRNRAPRQLSPAEAAAVKAANESAPDPAQPDPTPATKIELEAREVLDILPTLSGPPPTPVPTISLEPIPTPAPAQTALASTDLPPAFSQSTPDAAVQQPPVAAPRVPPAPTPFPPRPPIFTFPPFPTPVVSEEDKIFDEARNLMVEADFDRAAALFAQFVERFPQEERADRAQFFIGECFYRKRDYPKSIEAYSAVLTNHFGSTLAPEAAAKIGFAYSAQNDSAKAIEAFEYVVSEYPGYENISTIRDAIESLRRTPYAPKAN